MLSNKMGEIKLPHQFYIICNLITVGSQVPTFVKKKKKNEDPELPKQMLALARGKGKANSTSGVVVT